MSEVDLTRHLLSEQDSRQIFEQRIVPREMDGTAAVEHPVALFVAGQPGAGKTRTTADAVAAFAGHGGVVVVNSDTYKPYHPQWAQLMEVDDTTAALYTRLDGRRWMAHAYQWAEENRRNVLVETTMQGPDVFEEPVQRFRDAGYRIEVQAMAVPQALSRLGILDRYVDQVATKGTGRLTAVRNHDEAYQGMAQRLEMIDTGQVKVDLVSVWRRGGHLLYANERDQDGTWLAPARAAQVLQGEQQRVWDYPEAAEALATTRRVGAVLPERVRAQLRDVQDLTRPLLPPGAEAFEQARSASARLADPNLRGPSTDAGARTPPRTAQTTRTSSADLDR